MKVLKKVGRVLLAISVKLPLKLIFKNALVASVVDITVNTLYDEFTSSDNK